MTRDDPAGHATGHATGGTGSADPARLLGEWRVVRLQRGDDGENGDENANENDGRDVDRRGAVRIVLGRDPEHGTG
jgi:hypothetical protein